MPDIVMDVNMYVIMSTCVTDTYIPSSWVIGAASASCSRIFARSFPPDELGPAVVVPDELGWLACGCGTRSATHEKLCSHRGDHEYKQILK
jgi:hypothetical protein